MARPASPPRPCRDRTVSKATLPGRACTDKVDRRTGALRAGESAMVFLVSVRRGPPCAGTDDPEDRRSDWSLKGCKDWSLGQDRWRGSRFSKNGRVGAGRRRTSAAWLPRQWPQAERCTGLPAGTASTRASSSPGASSSGLELTVRLGQRRCRALPPSRSRRWLPCPHLPLPLRRSHRAHRPPRG